MKLVVFAITFAACASRANGPVPGAPEAFERHYPVTVVEAHAALIEVLTATYGGVVSDDGRHVVAWAKCRDKDGDPCAKILPSSGGPSFSGGGDVGAPSTAMSSAGSETSSLGADSPGAVVGHYWFQVYAGIAGTDGDLRIQLGGHAKDFKGKLVVVGEQGAPAWMPHEVDEVRVAVDRELAPR